MKIKTAIVISIIAFNVTADEEGWVYYMPGSGERYETLAEAEAVMRSQSRYHAVIEKYRQEIDISGRVIRDYRAPTVEPEPGVAYRGTIWTYFPYDDEGTGFSGIRTLPEAMSLLQERLAARPPSPFAGRADNILILGGVSRPDGTYWYYGYSPKYAVVDMGVSAKRPRCSTISRDVPFTRIYGNSFWEYGPYESLDLKEDVKVLAAYWCKPHWLLYSTVLHRIRQQNDYPWCPEGYDGSGYGSCINNAEGRIYAERVVECPIEPIKPLDYWIDVYHANDSQMAQLTRDLEANVDVPLHAMLTPKTQEAEACVSAKFAAGGFVDYKLESTRRSLAYQAHFHDLMQRWYEHGNVVEDSPNWEACAESREQVELEVGKRVGSDPREWNAPGGRFHQIVEAASPEGSKHPDGKSFDVSGVDDVIAYLAKDGPPALTVQDWVNQPTDCNVGWGGLFTKPDKVHFYLHEGEQQMEFIALIAALTAAMEAELPPDLHHGEPKLARLLVSGEHVGGDVVYHYTIVNQHPQEELIYLTLGVEYENGSAGPDLVEKPVGTEIIVEPDPQQLGFNRFWADMPESAWTAPPHWALHFIKMEYFPRFYLKFWLQRVSRQARTGEVQPGQQLDGFSIRLPKPDKTYYESGFEASFYYPGGQYFGYPEKLDTAPPELSVSVKKSELWPPNKKLADINVDIEVTDDYDSQPAITLVSITANEPLEDGDVQGAEFGSDDRSFQLRATRDGGNHEGRVYTVTHSAEDAFGHVTERSVTVTVPHDRH